MFADERLNSLRFVCIAALATLASGTFGQTKPADQKPSGEQQIVVQSKPEVPAQAVLHQFHDDVVAFVRATESGT